jgi:hypothetical protein
MTSCGEFELAIWDLAKDVVDNPALLSEVFYEHDYYSDQRKARKEGN